MKRTNVKRSLDLGSKTLEYYSLPDLVDHPRDLERLPYSLRVLLENMVRHEDQDGPADVEALLRWNPHAEPSHEIHFRPARVLLQDFTGVPCVVDLASMRDAMARLGGDPKSINPLLPVELVIDHSVQVDAYGTEAAAQINLDLEYRRNAERYQFLKWGTQAFDNFRVVPPNTGICHQVNLEHLSRVVFEQEGQAFFDTLVGTDSHTTMVNGLGVLGWGVGGIEAEAAMLGQSVTMLLPQVVGFKLSGKLREGATATDLVLTVTEMLRAKGVVSKFVEFFGPGIANLPVADRATIGNMSPEYGSTCAFFPVDAETLRYMRVTGRSDEHVARVEAYCRAQGMFHTPESPHAEYSSTLELNLADVVPSVAGPKRPQDRSRLGDAKKSFHAAFPSTKPKPDELSDGAVVIAAITSCTNTSNPSVMVAAGLVARKAAAKGLAPKPWVKTSLAPGSRVVTKYLERAGLLSDLEKVGFDVVGYGCTTCIGNSGPLPEDVHDKIVADGLTVVSVLSGNRNFEGRINQDTKANYLMSPPLVVAYSFVGTIETNLETDPLGVGSDGKAVYLRDIWPTQAEIAEIVEKHVTRQTFGDTYASVFEGDETWKEVPLTGSERYDWQSDSTYVREAPFFEGMPAEKPKTVAAIAGLRVLALLGDSVTTDHISPAGSIRSQSPAGLYLQKHGVEAALFNSYGSRRGNHEVMVRGTFANIRLRNQLVPGVEGGFTKYLPTGETMDIYTAATRYQENGVGLIVVAGKDYGSGSSRDWAAKGVLLLGVRAVLAESFERIHRSNLIGMGVLPLQFLPGQNAASLGLAGDEVFDMPGFPEAFASKFADGKKMRVTAGSKSFDVLVRLDTPTEREYFLNGGILQMVLRDLAKKDA